MFSMNVLAQAGSNGGGIGELIAIIFVLVVTVVAIASMWKIFTKAGQPGWAALIPFYNIFVLLQIVGRPTWWLILFFIPFINSLVGLVLTLDLAKSFGKSMLFGLGLILLSIIFMPILAFGDAQYQGQQQIF